MHDAQESRPRGRLIVVEGLDRSGKSSQCQKVHDHIVGNGGQARYVKFPDRTTPTGKMINSYLTGSVEQDDHSIHLLFSANRWEAIKGIERDISNGINVIIDRYSFSGAVYSAAKGNPDLSLDWAWYPEIGLLKPDLLLFLDISPEDAAKRGNYGDERYETEKMQARVRTLFKELFARVGDLDVCLVDAGRSIEVVSQDIFTAIAKLSNDGPLTGILGKLGPLLRSPTIQ